MTNSVKLNRLWISIGIPFLIFGLLGLLAQSNLFEQNASLGSFAITFDLLITVPIVYYLLIRKLQIPIATVVPIVLIGVLIGTYTLPAENQHYLNLFKVWGLPLIELSIISFVILKVRRSIRFYKVKKQSNPDFFSSLRESCSELVPEKLVPFVASEIAVIYYGFIRWKKNSIQPNEFTYHKNSGTPALIAILIFIVFVETLVFHILLVRWNVTAAWILSALSIYTAIQLLGFLKSLSQRPINLNENDLIIRYGILAETTIELSAIESIELSNRDLDSDKLTRKLSPFGTLESHNTLIKLKTEQTLTGLYGSRKKFTKLALHIDNNKEFKQKLDTLLDSLEK